MNYKQFEDLPVWQESRNLVKQIYELTSSAPLQKDFGFKDQIQRASISIMNNIAEGFERDNNSEFIRFLYFAKGSAGEVRSMLYIAKDLKYINDETFDNLHNQSSTIIKQIANFIKYLKTKK